MTLVIDITCKGASSGQRVLLEDGETLNVGRANEDLDLVADPQLSRKHFILRYCNHEIEITHLSRTNPTLVAGDGSTDFVEIAGKRVEPHGCRIIAGSHRFVAVVEAPDSIIEPTLSSDDQAEIWSDVDSEGEPSPFCFDSFPEVNEKGKVPEEPQAGATIRNPNIKPTPPPPALKTPTPAKPMFSVDESNPKVAEPSDASGSAEPEVPLASRTPAKPAPSKEDKKIFFPIEDDFFD